MFGTLLRKLRFLRALMQKNHENGERLREVRHLSGNLTADLGLLRQLLGWSSDIGVRRFKTGAGGQVEAAIVFIDGLVDKEQIHNHILRPLLFNLSLTGYRYPRHRELIDLLPNVLTTKDSKPTGKIAQIVDALLSGHTVLLIDGSRQALVLETKGWEYRAIEKPETEGVVRGPRAGFTENLRTNTAMLRRIIRDPHLTFEHLLLGRRTKTEVVIAYIKGLADTRLIAELKRRLRRITTDAILESGYIEQFIEDNPFSLFATIGNSEKPDKVASKLLEGRAAILVDGTPFVLTVPMLFIESFQNTEDYYTRPYFATLMRWVRFLSFTLSVLSPALYVALTTFHQELIPTPLLITVAAAREGTPFPEVVEALGMIIVFEILREAGVRMPRPLGQAVSIVGALVIGQASVAAGLIGAPMVIVVAIMAITSFIVPPLEDAGAILRLAFTFLAGTLGLFGILIGLLQLLIHLVSLRSFGAPYLSPVTPLSISGLKDTLLAVPAWAMSTRPRSMSRNNPIRQKYLQMPRPPAPKTGQNLSVRSRGVRGGHL